MTRVVRMLMLFAVGLLAVAGCGNVPPAPTAGSSPGQTPENSVSASPTPSTRSSVTPTPSSPSTPTPTGEPSTSASAAGETCEYTATGTAAKPVKLPTATGVPDSGVVTVTLSMSDELTVRFAMDRAEAPCTAHSFESLVAQRYYDGTRCHRLVDSGIFVLYCGDPTGTGAGGPGYTFADETQGNEKYSAGTVAMASGGPNTNGSQFFVVYEDSTLPPNYTVFGKLDADSIGTVAAIAYQGQDGSKGRQGGRPNNPAEIIKASVSAPKGNVG